MNRTFRIVAVTRVLNTYEIPVPSEMLKGMDENATLDFVEELFFNAEQEQQESYLVEDDGGELEIEIIEEVE